MMIASNCAWRVVVCMRSSKESSRFFSVEAVALPNLPQTFRGRKRSKRGYTVDPLVKLYILYSDKVKISYTSLISCSSV